MNVWANTVITEKGLALLAKLAQGNTLDIVEAVTGTGWVTPGLLQKQTGVTNPKTTMAFRPVSYPENGACSMPVTMTNDGLDIGYEATQVGVFATDPDEGKILFLIAQSVTADKGTTVPSETEMPGYSAEWTFLFKYGQADGVNVTVNPANTVSRAEMERYMAQVLEEYAPVAELPTLHVWRRYSSSPGAFIETENVECNLGTRGLNLDEDGLSPGIELQCADKFYVKNQRVFLDSPQTVTLIVTSQVSKIAGKYISKDDAVYYVDPNATIYFKSGFGSEIVYVGPATKIEPRQFLGYIADKERNTYPDSGWRRDDEWNKLDEFYYEYQGQLGEAPPYTYGTEDLEAGVSKLETGKLYFVYE